MDDEELQAYLDKFNHATSLGRMVVANDILERARDALKAEFGDLASQVMLCALNPAIRRARAGRLENVPDAALMLILMTVCDHWFDEDEDSEN